MDNQHKQIRGYRDLSADEIAMMNEIKGKAAEVGDLVEKIAGSRATPEGKRWAATAKTDQQKGFMALTRAVALPDSF